MTFLVILFFGIVLADEFEYSLVDYNSTSPTPNAIRNWTGAGWYHESRIAALTGLSLVIFFGFRAFGTEQLARKTQINNK